MVNTYSAPISTVDSSTARWIVRRGFLVSSASGAAPSKPPKARIVKTDPAITPLMPWNPVVVYLVVKTDKVLLLPACTTRKMASTRNTPISNTPRTVPSRAEVLMP